MSRSIDAEQHLLACAMIEESKVPELLEIDEKWFQYNEHKLIIRAMRALANQNLSVDMFSVADELERTKQLGMVGGMEYITQIAEYLPSLSMWGSFKTSLFEHYKIRCLGGVSQNLQMMIDTGAKPQEIIESLQAQVIDLMTDHHTSGFKKVGDYLDEVVAELEWRQENKGQLLGQKTGFKGLDFTLDGLQDGRVYVIAGRPGAGKTAFSLALADSLTELQKPWFFFSLEMTGKSLAKRMLVRSSGIYNTKFRSGDLSDKDCQALGRGMGAVQDRTLNVDQTPSLSIAQMRSRLKAAQVRYGTIGGIVVDHIGLVKKDARKSDTEAMNIIADELLGFAKEFDCPMVELCQLNRGVEGRQDKRPMMSDLKQSGKIEENADVIMLLYRDDYYDREAAPITEINVAKNRDGETKTHYLKHDMAVGSYEELPDYAPPKPEPKVSRAMKKL